MNDQPSMENRIYSIFVAGCHFYATARTKGEARAQFKQMCGLWPMQRLRRKVRVAGIIA